MHFVSTTLNNLFTIVFNGKMSGGCKLLSSTLIVLGHYNVFHFFIIVILCFFKDGCNHNCVTAIDPNQQCQFRQIGPTCYYQFPVMKDWQANYDFCQEESLKMIQFSDVNVPYLEFNGTQHERIWLDKCKYSTSLLFEF